MMKKIAKNKLLFIGSIIFVSLVVLVMVGPLLVSWNPNSVDASNRLMWPSGTHLLGTDEYGRDLLARVLQGGRISLLLGTVVMIVAVTLGTVIGLYSAYYERVGNVLMRVIDGIMAIPGLLLAIALMSAFGGSIYNLMIILSIVYIPSTARLVRSSALDVINEPFVGAIQLIGASDTRVIWKHLFPNIIPSLAVQATFVYAGAILGESTLSFLGAGIPAPAPSWGNIIQGGRTVIFSQYYIVLFPSIAVLLAVISLHLLGEGLRDALDPKQLESEEA
ncbi:ABC transporter permease [Dolosigranulum pigrum]|jgi:ABC transporter, permease protein|nr:ABC transporter permease [Dolosigranulum pigrum]